MKKASPDLFQLLAETFTSEWRKYANCIDADLDLFMEEDRFEEGRKYCTTCPVAIECLDNAIFYDDGGLRLLTPKERNSIVMHRRRHNQAFNHDVKS
jgi:hypothetical protein